jgi:DNA-binding MarR family transcriptional regulator
MTVEEANFSFIKDTTKAAAGNVSIQIGKLQEAGYINVEKTFRNNYPNTAISITDKGRKAFEEYVKNLQQYIYPEK